MGSGLLVWMRCSVWLLLDFIWKIDGVSVNGMLMFLGNVLLLLLLSYVCISVGCLLLFVSWIVILCLLDGKIMCVLVIIMFVLVCDVSVMMVRVSVWRSFNGFMGGESWIVGGKWV